MDTTPVGVIEIAERLKVTRDAVNNWRRHGRDVGFPEPRWTVGGRPAWDWHRDIEAWARDSGRLP
jgi:hypothetical protein